MDKNVKTTENSSVKLTEVHSSENNSAAVSNSNVDVLSAVPLAVEKAADGGSKSQSRNQFDRQFDEFGFWILVFVATFIVTGFLIPSLFLKNIGDANFAFFVLILGAIGSGSSLVALFLWFLLRQIRIFGMLRIAITVWCPVLLSLSQAFYGVPGSLLRVSNNDHYSEDLLFNILICLVLPSLLGSSFALLGLLFRSKFLQRKEEKEDI